jgi:O-antigen/teichoic acid export membrane protein
MSNIRKLAGQTAVYGLSSILGRILGYLLVPIYTRVLSEGAYGSVIELYSYVALFLIVLTYGMETAFFRFAESSGERNKVFSTGLISILASSALFLILVLIFQIPLAQVLRYPDNPNYLIYLALILFFDSINTIPFANLRAQNKAIKFVSIRLTGIFLNISLNLLLIIGLPYAASHGNLAIHDWAVSIYNPKHLVSYILISNLISSGVMTLMFLPQFLKIRFRFDPLLWRKMLVYALPLLVFGLAGVVNEVIDRVLLKYLLPENIAMAQVGIYGACYKVSIIMTIFIQAYRYAAEPFFFSQQKEKDAKETYATLMTWFVMTTSIIFLATMLFIDVVILFVGEPFRVGAPVIPILLMANMFLGIYYNLSVWYKLTDNTKYGAYISLAGAVVTLLLNFIWIPRIGYMGSAWATLIVYGLMMTLSWFFGRKHYPIPYEFRTLFILIFSALALYQASVFIGQFIDQQGIKFLINSLILIAYLGFLLILKRDMFKSLLARN